MHMHSIMQSTTGSIAKVDANYGRQAAFQDREFPAAQTASPVAVRAACSACAVLQLSDIHEEVRHGHMRPLQHLIRVSKHHV